MFKMNMVQIAKMVTGLIYKPIFSLESYMKNTIQNSEVPKS